MDGGGVVGDESLEVVVDLEVIGHVAVLLPVRLIKLNTETDRKVEFMQRGGGVVARDSSELWVCGWFPWGGQTVSPYMSRRVTFEARGGIPSPGFIMSPYWCQ